MSNLLVFYAISDIGLSIHAKKFDLDLDLDLEIDIAISDIPVNSPHT